LFFIDFNQEIPNHSHPEFGLGLSVECGNRGGFGEKKNYKERLDENRKIGKTTCTKTE
jgi:hypothetical protein